MAQNETVLDDGALKFSVETRLLRELGERLVKQPEVALVELIKNAYDADAIECQVDCGSRRIRIDDDGSGITLDRFENAWMRIGTRSKVDTPLSERFGRGITGEKGIGRFAVRFLGGALHLDSVAYDESRNMQTRLTADFDWPQFDQSEDLQDVLVPYRLVRARRGTRTGTRLTISNLRVQSDELNLNAVRTGSIGILSPLRSLFMQTDGKHERRLQNEDPGFRLNLSSGPSDEAMDVGAAILDAYVLRAKMSVTERRVDLRIYRKGEKHPELEINDAFENDIGGLDADIRFFPRRKGTFANLPVNGRYVQGWIKEHHGVAVFDRLFRVQPYGTEDDDWLSLQADAAINRRAPRSRLAKKHLSMTDDVQNDTRLNWMLRLPQSSQLVGLVRVKGSRGADSEDGRGLIASADREGFLDNDAFRQMRSLVRSAVEAIAFVDRELQLKEEARERAEQLATARMETKAAIEEIEANPHIAATEKKRIVSTLVNSQRVAEEQGAQYREREEQLEVLSMLGVVAGFMTHEFGIALSELEIAHRSLAELGKKHASIKKQADQFKVHIDTLKEYMEYTTLYIEGARSLPSKVYLAKPRITRIKRIYGKYARTRGIKIDVGEVSDVNAPMVPVSLYDGLAINLFTNALKAVTTKAGKEPRTIAFRVWNERRWHYLEVSDTGIGIPAVLRKRVFDPLFTTTDSRNDPLGPGMGLGLTLIRRNSEAFGGRVAVVSPRRGFATTIRIQLPMDKDRNK